MCFGLSMCVRVLSLLPKVSDGNLLAPRVGRILGSLVHHVGLVSPMFFKCGGEIETGTVEESSCLCVC